MATNRQIKLMLENPECVELATIMSLTVYPKIVGLMKKLGMEEVRFEQITGFRNCSLTIDSELHFFTLDKDGKKADNIYKLKCAGTTICPLFSRKEQSETSNPHESPTERYIRFYRAVMKSIEPLEQKLVDIEETLAIARNICIPLKREVLIEKTNSKSL